MDIFLVHAMTWERGILEKGKGCGKLLQQENWRDDIGASRLCRLDPPVD
jgi:hypothetical protein